MKKGKKKKKSLASYLTFNEFVNTARSETEYTWSKSQSLFVISITYSLCRFKNYCLFIFTRQRWHPTKCLILFNDFHFVLILFLICFFSLSSSPSLGFFFLQLFLLSPYYKPGKGSC